MPRRLENDRWLFGVTLVLCLVGAVMVYSRVGGDRRPTLRPVVHFSAAAGGVAGDWDFWDVCADAAGLPETAGAAGGVHGDCASVLLMLLGAFFLDKSHATHRWIKFGPVGIQPSELAKLAVILYLAWFLDSKRRAAAKMEFCKEDFMQTILPAVAPILVSCADLLAQPDLGPRWISW